MDFSTGMTGKRKAVNDDKSEIITTTALILPMLVWFLLLPILPVFRYIPITIPSLFLWQKLHLRTSQTKTLAQKTKNE